MLALLGVVVGGVLAATAGWWADNRRWARERRSRQDEQLREAARTFLHAIDATMLESTRVKDIRRGQFDNILGTPPDLADTTGLNEVLRGLSTAYLDLKLIASAEIHQGALQMMDGAARLYHLVLGRVVDEEAFSSTFNKVAGMKGFFAEKVRSDLGLPAGDPSMFSMTLRGGPS